MEKIVERHGLEELKKVQTFKLSVHVPHPTQNLVISVCFIEDEKCTKDCASGSMCADTVLLVTPFV